MRFIGRTGSLISHLICLEKEPILATDAVQVMTDNVNQDEAVLLLGHPLKIAAEREDSSQLTDNKILPHAANQHCMSRSFKSQNFGNQTGTMR